MKLTLEEVLEQYLALQWRPEVTAHPAGGHQLTLSGLPDFKLFAAHKAELEREWRTALKAHLRAYLLEGKVIPVPVFSPAKDSTKPEKIAAAMHGTWGNVVQLGVDLSLIRTIHAGEAKVA